MQTFAFDNDVKNRKGSSASSTDISNTVSHDSFFSLNCHLKGVRVARVSNRPNRACNWHKQAGKRVQLHQDLKDSRLPSSVPCVNDGIVHQDGNYHSLVHEGQNAKVHNIEAGHSFGHSVWDAFRDDVIFNL